MPRFLLLLALAVIAFPAAAQRVYDSPVYNGLDDPYEDDAMPGVRIGIGVGPYIYAGPDILVGRAADQDDVIATNLGVTAELSFPLAGQLYGRLMGGLVNIGADDDRPDLPLGPSQNPYLTSQTILAEADLMYYLARPGRGAFAPYVFSGISALFATGDAEPGIETTALAIPVGLGFEYGVSRNVALFAEGSFRFGLTEVGSTTGAAFATAADVCDAAGPDYNYAVCIKKNREPYCSNGGELPDCDEVDNHGDSDFRTRFNSGLILGGVRIGFASAPAPYIPPYVPPVETPPVYVPPPVETPPAPQVCDLVELNSVTFDYGSGTLNRRARARLDENIELLLENPACCVFIDGYTDTPEGSQFGLGLAGRRAQAVYDYYLGAGVSASRLQVRNRGVASPDCDKEDPGMGCELNRRVESLPVDCERFQFLLDNPSYDPY